MRRSRAHFPGDVPGALALGAVLLASCGGPSAKAPPPSEPLVIPPIGSAGAAPIPLPRPEAPPARHLATMEECKSIMRRVVELTLDSANLVDPATREETMKAFMANADPSIEACNGLTLDAAGMRCFMEAPRLDVLYECLDDARNSARGDDDD